MTAHTSSESQQPVSLNQPMPHRKVIREWLIPLSQRTTVRAFVLLKAPWQNDESTAIDWAIRSVQWAIDQGVRVSCVIPTRRGNAALEDLHAAGQFAPPQLSSLEKVLDTLLQQKSPTGDPRVFVDTWDLAQFASCKLCLDARRERLETMNRTQTVLPSPPCECRAMERSFSRDGSFSG